MKLSDLNARSTDQFLDIIGGPLEGERWLAERIVKRRPFSSIEALFEVFSQVILGASEAEKIQLIASHPDLAPEVGTSLSTASVQEQASAGLDTLTTEEYAMFNRLNTQYRERFNFSFVICAREHNKSSILAHFQQRLQHTRAQEIEIGIVEVLKIIQLRLHDLIEITE
ncbi:MAG: 2-oxo-4-hydroxy-4-carboxy-5-ureidoimidazoline decarboxylase [Anaerolineae bacterium]